MSSLKSIEERVKEFRDFMFGHGEKLGRMLGKGKGELWLETTLTSDRHAMGERVLEWAEKSKQKKPKSKCMNLENHMFGSCFACKMTDGYNQALTDLETFIKETI